MNKALQIKTRIDKGKKRCNNILDTMCKICMMLTKEGDSYEDALPYDNRRL